MFIQQYLTSWEIQYNTVWYAIALLFPETRNISGRNCCRLLEYITRRSKGRKLGGILGKENIPSSRHRNMSIIKLKYWRNQGRFYKRELESRQRPEISGDEP